MILIYGVSLLPVGILRIFRSAKPLEQQEKEHPELEPGGHYRPPNCTARHRVAIIIPYRNRAEQLPPFFNHMHAFLQRQQIEYSIFIVEQTGNDPFNRGFLMNVGAIEALKRYKIDCFVFHDVDLLPEDDRNLYTCPDQPRHLSTLVDSLGYKLLSVDMFGGVTSLTTEQFKIVNGFSNKFWGWGGEDDDMGNRVKFHGFLITRYPLNIGRYTMLTHKKAVPGPDRFKNLYSGSKRFATDGINSAKYKVLDIKIKPLYTWIAVQLYNS
ncbi:beta-1,4-N-acetylgalactosaminyltransferase bre-4-like [Palaemon carinicauda]|uniref:beta-1,4-N-acetylgalactosaminyltransferase bre-4-like n=1 Tax=Palaemon carinicauda TaxID=392227 RepID=UPI0035B5D884